MEKTKKDCISITAFGKNFQFLDQLKKENNKNFCIYGCGVNGEIICNYLKRLGFEISFFVDKQAEKREFYVLDKRVISPAKYFEQYMDLKIIVSPDNQESIVDFLLRSGVDAESIIRPIKKINWDVWTLGDDYDERLYMSDIVQAEDQEKDIEKSLKATVFTILYNTPKWMLCRAIESVLRQSYKGFRYLIIDNGSTDGSDEVIKNYAKKDKRITYIRLKKNVVWTRKELLKVLQENISTEYVAMLDSDDYYEPNFLEKTIRIAEKKKADIVQVNTLTYGHEGFKYNHFTQSIGENLNLTGKKKERYLMLRILDVPVWGKLYSTELFKQLISMMLTYDSEDERDRNFCLDISWTTYMVMQCRKAVICDEILHIRTWRRGSSEHTDDHCPKWLSSIIWSFHYLRDQGVDCEAATVYEDATLVWLFGLSRDQYDLADFRADDIGYESVVKFLQRPVCDRYRR